MADYRIISGDSHVVEPPDLWETRIEPRSRIGWSLSRIAVICTTDQAKQAQLVEQMTAILDKDQPILLWGSNLITIGWKTDVKGHNMPNRSIGEPSRWDLIWLDR